MRVPESELIRALVFRFWNIVAGERIGVLCPSILKETKER
jgi:hypothetical protein